MNNVESRNQDRVYIGIGLAPSPDFTKVIYTYILKADHD